MSDTKPPETAITGGESEALPQPVSIVSKRQRRPSVRLGDIISDEIQVYRRASSKSKQNKNNDDSSSKARALTNLSKVNEGPADKDANLDAVIGSWRVKDPNKRTAKRARSKWSSKVNSSSVVENDNGNGYHHDEGDGNDREGDCQIVVRSGEGNEGNGEGVEFPGPFDTEGRRESFGVEDDPVRIWLNGLGLGRYAPVFEIHEIDPGVLPLLTLEDLKDMGISAVGSRRKMFCAIKKLGRGFS